MLKTKIKFIKFKRNAINLEKKLKNKRIPTTKINNFFNSIVFLENNKFSFFLNYPSN